MPDYFVGFDVGKIRDYSAIAVLERDNDRLNLRHLERLKLGTPYPEVVRRVTELVRKATLHGPTELVMDATGVGQPVLDALRDSRLRVVPITITNSRGASERAGIHCVPKRELTRSLVTAFESGYLKIAAGLPSADELTSELLNFTRRLNPRTGHERYEAQRSTDHDDLVLAIALACWRAQKTATADAINAGTRVREH
jgi:hypothetical protein